MDKLFLSVNTTLVGLVVVFSALILLAFIISLYSKILGGSAKKSAREASASPQHREEAVTESVQSTDDEELAAVLTAAVIASMGSHSDIRLRVKSFRRIPTTSPTWNVAGRQDQILNKL